MNISSYTYVYVLLQISCQEPIQLVRLRAAGLISEYVGMYSKSSLEWDEVPQSEVERFAVKHLADGEFW